MRALAIVTALAMWLAPIVAKGDAARAQTLFEAGRKALAMGAIKDACTRFEASLAEERALGTLLNLADCWERDERLTEAVRAFRDAAAWAKRTRETKRYTVATQRANAIEERLATAPAPITVAPSAPVNPPVNSEPIAPVPAPVVVEKPAQSPTPTPAPITRRTLRRSAQAAIGVGVGALALFGVGAGVGVIAQRDWRDAQTGCDAASVCEPASHRKAESAARFADASTAFFVLGGVAAATSVALGVVAAIAERNDRRNSRSSSSLTIVPTVAPASIAVHAALRF